MFHFQNAARTDRAVVGSGGFDLVAVFAYSVVVVLTHVFNFFGRDFWCVDDDARVDFACVVVVENYVYKEPVSEE